MTYTTGGPIQATDYNGFVTLANGMNEIFGDIHPGATTLPNAGFGYGQTPVPAAVVIGQDVTAAQWSGLFTMMRKTGAHQTGSVLSVEPPVPSANPIIGDTIVAENNPTLLSAKIAELRANKFNVWSTQVTVSPGTPYSQTGATIPWVNTLTFNCQADFGSWNNARYFFNSGGSLLFYGASSVVNQWSTLFDAFINPLAFKAIDTIPTIGGSSGFGFYNLTASYQQAFQIIAGGPYYAGSTFTLYAKLNAAAGTNGLVDFQIVLDDNDPTPDPKNSTTTYTLGNIMATGSNVSYPGGLTFTSAGANNGFIAT